VTIRCELPADLPAISGDPDRIEQVLVNLIDNAIKYTPAGGRVRVGARVSPPPHPATVMSPSQVGPQSWIEISVADTGIGIPSQELPRLTERFYRVDKARSRELGGTGLGLAIVKHIVLAHGGALRIESELGEGTRVAVYVPAAQPQAQPTNEPYPVRLSA
jgi:two-component system phosphate regulon sensor histidine kinase PhoR